MSDIPETDAGERRDSKGNHPSMVGAHARYIQGAISSTLGYNSGETTKDNAVRDMRRASEVSSSGTGTSPPSDQPMQSTILGTIEKTLGQVTGCEGMEKEGEQRMVEKAGSEETSGTG